MYLLGFPQLDPTSGDGFGAVSPRGTPWSTASKSASTVSLFPSLLLLTSIMEQTGAFLCELLEVFRCSVVVPKFGDSSYLKPPECHSCSHPLRKKKKRKETRPQSRCAGLVQRKGHFHLCLFIPMLLVRLDSYFWVWLIHLKQRYSLMVQSPLFIFCLGWKHGALGN